MTARCDRCGRYCRGFRILRSQVRPDVAYLFCIRCSDLRDRGWFECHNTVVGRSGIEDACGRAAYVVVADPDTGHRYPVCRKHFREFGT